jgi:hypothetical protein
MTAAFAVSPSCIPPFSEPTGYSTLCYLQNGQSLCGRTDGRKIGMHAQGPQRMLHAGIRAEFRAMAQFDPFVRTKDTL